MDGLRMTERELLAEVVKMAKEHNLLIFHAYDSRKTTGKGFPDLVILGKKLIAVELKSQHGGLTPEQVQWKYSLLAANIDFYTWKPQHLTEGTIEEILKDLAQDMVP